VAARGTIIIGFAEALAAPEVAWSLVDCGFRVLAFNRSGQLPALRHSRFVEVFSIADPDKDLRQAGKDLESAVLRCCKGLPEVLAVMPLDDQAVCLCGRAMLPDHVVVIGPRGEEVEIALNKHKQLECARAAGFSVPQSRYLERPEEVLRYKVSFPVILKPARAVVQRGMGFAKGRCWICASAAELEAALSGWSTPMPMLLQRFIPGVGEGLFGLSTSCGVIGWSGHRRLRMMNPQGSGSSACTAVPEIEAESKSAAEQFLARVGWRGLFMIEMLRDSTGKLWFIEFNGRPWGSMALARRRGFEYPAWAALTALSLGEAFRIPQMQNRVPVCRHVGREILYLLYVSRGSKSRAITNWPSIWTALSQVVRIGRNDCWYNWRRNDPLVFVSDCLGTLRHQLLKSRCHL
jgi:predicted ATP-grasp superfamily ATP-dependent carboligase